jgi:hypothetical protein
LGEPTYIADLSCKDPQQREDRKMSPLKFLLIMPLVFAGPALAQGTHQKGVSAQPQGTTGGVRTPVATQPSNNPFRNPIGQGVPPAASANSRQNGNQTNTTGR